MTVCIATDVFYPAIGGIANYYKYLSSILSDAGHSVIILTINENAGPATEDSILQEKNITKIILGASYAKHRDYLKQFFRPGSYGAPGWIAMGKAMHEWLKKNHHHYKIDVIEIGDYGGTGILLADDDLPPVIVIGHSSLLQLCRYNHVDNNSHAAVIKKMEMLSYIHCNAVAAHSPMNVDDLNKITGKNIFFCRAPWIPPVDVSDFSVEPKSKNIIVSGLQITKGAALMAEATKLIINKNKNWTVYWIGGDTNTAPGGQPVSAYLEKKYKEVWNKNFIWVKQQDHLAVMNTLRHAKTAIIPSLWETFNYFALEAVFFQRPLFITENTGAAYLFKEDENVKIISSGSVASIAEVVLQQSVEKSKKTVTTETKEMLINYFSAQNIIEERMKLYNEVLKNRQPHYNTVTESLFFLKAYITPARKLYFNSRKKAKQLLRGKKK